MKKAVETALEKLAEKSVEKDIKPHEAMQLTQSALNLAHVLATLANIK